MSGFARCVTSLISSEDIGCKLVIIVMEEQPFQDEQKVHQQKPFSAELLTWPHLHDGRQAEFGKKKAQKSHIRALEDGDGVDTLALRLALIPELHGRTTSHSGAT